MHDIAHYLRPSHLKQLASILDDPEASANDRFVATDLLKNANISAAGVLPMCQDTGTAIVMGKKGRLVLTDGHDENGSRGASSTPTEEEPALLPARPLSMFEEKNTKNNLPAQIEIYAEGEERL
jgi:fumarate hydratase, class I